MEIKDYQLTIFDVDGTIANRDEDRLLPEARDFFKLLYQWSAVATLPKLALATNQGGVGLRWWMIDSGWGNPDELPTLKSVEERLRAIQQQIPLPTMLYTAYAYQSQKTREWSPVPMEYVGRPEWSRAWRKPNPGMIQQAMVDYGVADPRRVLFVGDQPEDEGAAVGAGVAFCWVKLFWVKVPEFINLSAVGG